MSQENHRSSLYYVIPASVFEDERLEESEIMFYGLLSGLANNTGYCFASDKYLAERRKVHERTIPIWLAKLEKCGHIVRETKKVGMKWDRKIFIHTGLSKNVYERVPTPVSNRSPDQDRTGPHTGIVSKDISNIREKEIYKEKEPEILSFGSHVKILPEAYEKLCKEHTVEVITDMIERINDYIDSTGSKGYKDYAATIRNWLKNQKDKHPQGKIAPPPNKLFFDRFKQVFGNSPNITIGSDYIEFIFSGAIGSQVISIKEHGFKEQVLNRMRKMGLSTKELE